MKKEDKTLSILNANHPRQLIMVHFISPDGKIKEKEKIPYDVLLSHPYFIKTKKGHYQIDDGNNVITDKETTLNNTYFVNIKDKDEIMKDKKIVSFGVKDGMTRMGYQKDLDSKNFANEFIKVINTKTAEYITVYQSDLNDTQKGNMRRRATVNIDPMHPSNRRSVEVNNDDFQKLYDKCSYIDIEKLHNMAKKESVVLEKSEHTKHTPVFNESKVANFYNKKATPANSMINFNNIKNEGTSKLPSITKNNEASSSKSTTKLPPITKNNDASSNKSTTKLPPISR